MHRLWRQNPSKKQSWVEFRFHLREKDRNKHPDFLTSLLHCLSKDQNVWNPLEADKLTKRRKNPLPQRQQTKNIKFSVVIGNLLKRHSRRNWAINFTRRNKENIL